VWEGEKDDTKETNNNLPLVKKEEKETGKPENNPPRIEIDNNPQESDANSNHDSNSNYDDDDGDEWNEMENREWIHLPFELQCVDACLHIISEILLQDTRELQTIVQTCLFRILKDKSSGGSTALGDPLVMIRSVKDAAHSMSSRVKGFSQSIIRLLNEDEDMALMNLSRLLTHPERYIQPVPPEILEEESDEPELILEAYLQTALSMLNSLELMDGQIHAASELVDQKLNSIQNRLLLANMVISVFFLCITCVATVGSFMGTNLRNFMEEDPHVFKYICYGSVGCGFVLGYIIMYILFRTNAIPRI
jgi:hypothetical protein